MITTHSNRELWTSFFAVLGITLLYLFVVAILQTIPAASDFFGHALGIIGFLMMIATEVLYTLRKRSRSARWGKMASWLQFHIFTGLVGPYMVLLHSSWKFNGLAGIVTLFTIIVVLSGFVGRYIYTAVPRTADGIELEAGALAIEEQRLQAAIDNWLKTQSPETRLLAQRLGLKSSSASALSLSRGFQEFFDRIQWFFESKKIDAPTRLKVDELRRIMQRRETLRAQVASLAMARRLLAIWHTVHVPIGMALFTAAVIHIGAAIYYATLLH